MKKEKILLFTLVGAIIALGIFVRLWHLGSIPPGAQYDEAYNAYNAINVIETGNYDVFYPENFGREGFFMNTISFSLRIFGFNNFGLRFPSALFGSLAVIGFFLLLRRLNLSWLTSLMGTFMLATSFWHLDFSRTSYRAIMVPFLIIWIFYFFLEGIQRKKWYFFALSGALFGLGFHTYIAFRVVPLVVITFSIALMISIKSFLKIYYKSALVFIFSALFIILPIFLYFFNHSSDFTGRSSAVSIFNAPGLTVGQAFGRSLFSHLQAFYLNGDANARHGYDSQPLIPLAWAILFSFGFFLSLKEILHSWINRWKKQPATDLYPASFLAQSIFWIMLIPGVLSIEGIPHALRIIGSIPGVFLLTCLPFEYIFKFYSRIKNSDLLPVKTYRFILLKISIAIIVFVVLLSGFIQLFTYFGLWANDKRTFSAFERELFDLGKIVSSLAPKPHNYLITAPDIAISNDRKESSLKTTEFSGYPNIKAYTFFHPIDGLKETSCQNAQFVFQHADSWLIDQFSQKCPELKKEKIAPEKGLHGFWVLK